MTLLNAGYWQTTYWTNRYWNPLYWQSYGYVPPPTIIPPPTGGGMGKRRGIPRARRLHPQTLSLIKKYLEMKLENE